MIMITRRVPYRYTRDARERDGAHGPFDAEVRAAGMTPRVEVILHRQEPEGDVVRERVMYADEVAVQLATTVIPKAVAMTAGLDKEDTGTGGMMSRLADAGYAPVKFTETIMHPLGRGPRPEECERLGLDGFLGEPGGHLPLVVDLVHCAYAKDGTLVEYTMITMVACYWQLEFEWDEKSYWNDSGHVPAGGPG